VGRKGAAPPPTSWPLPSGVCWRYWQRVGDEVRIWTTYRDASCVLIASLTGERTRLTCDGRTATL
jgi:hypothetical protein